MAKLSPVFNDQTIDANGDPYVGAKLFTYVAGSSTKQAVYTDAAGTVPHSNPIILNSLGFPTQGAIWIPEGISVKFVLASPTDTDPPTSPIKTIDSVQGVNDAGATVSEWQASGVSPTYISTISFSLAGDQTNAFHKGRRVQFTTSGGTKYGKIINTAYTSLTTVTMLMDGTDVLDSGLSVANLSILRADVQSLPNPIEMLRSAVVGHATLTPTWDRAYGEIQDVSGVVTYTAIPDAPRPGATRIWYPAAGATMTHGGNISVQGNASVTAASGDKWIINAVTTSTFYVEVIRKSVLPAPLSPSQYPMIVLANNATDATNDIDIAAGSTVDSTLTSILTIGAFTKRLDAAWAVGSGNGGLDTGVIADGTYHLYLIQKDTDGTEDAIFSASATAPTMPAGYTKFGWIGSIVRASGAILLFTQVRDVVMWKTSFLDYDAAVGTTASSIAIRVPTGIKVDASIIAFYSNSASANNTLYVSSLDQTDEAAGNAGRYTVTNVLTTSISSGLLDVITNTSGQIRARSDNATNNTRINVSKFKYLRG